MPIEQCKVANVNVVGAILNRVEIEKHSSFYSPHYSPRYGDYLGGEPTSGDWQERVVEHCHPRYLEWLQSVESVKQSGSTSTDAITVWCDSEWRFHAAGHAPIPSAP